MTLTKEEYLTLVEALVLYDADHDDDPLIVAATDAILMKIRRGLKPPNEASA